MSIYNNNKLMVKTKFYESNCPSKEWSTNSLTYLYILPSPKNTTLTSHFGSSEEKKKKKKKTLKASKESRDDRDSPK